MTQTWVYFFLFKTKVTVIDQSQIQCLNVKIFPTSVTKIVPEMYHIYIYHICNVHNMFTSPKRSKLNDVGLKVVQSSCTVTSISKIKSTTAFLSVSTAFLKPIGVIQQQMQAIMKHFAALDFYGFLSPACKKVCSGQGGCLFLGLTGSEIRSIDICTQNPRLLGLSHALGGAAALDSKEDA